MIPSKLRRILGQLVRGYCVLAGILLLAGGVGFARVLWLTHFHPFHYSTQRVPLQAVPLPPPAHPLSTQELAQGERQVEAMVRDRPEMSRYVHKGDPLWQFCARQYGGEATGSAVLWGRVEPEDANASHDLPDGTLPGRIYIRSYDNIRQRAISCEELWSYAVYELCNIRTYKQHNANWAAALSGRIDREEWIQRTARLEYSVLPYVVSLYQTLWKPAMDAKGIQTTPDLWWVNTPAAYDKWIVQFTDPKGYPWGIYGKQYDEAVMRKLRQVAKEGSL